MGADLVVRDLVEADLPLYKRLRDDMLAGHEDAFTSDAEAERQKPADAYLVRLSGQGDDARFTLGAWLHGELVGAVSCDRDTRAKVRHIGHLSGMMVRQAARKRGIGRTLLEHCIAHAKRVHGLEMMTLSVTSSNAGAVRLYESIGFKRYGRLVHALKIGPHYHDKDLMVLMF